MDGWSQLQFNSTTVPACSSNDRGGRLGGGETKSWKDVAVVSRGTVLVGPGRSSPTQR